MRLDETSMIKMGEANIIAQYSAYLQGVSLNGNSALVNANRIVHHDHFLGYDEFKEYYILTLVGKSGYIEKVTSELQGKLISGVI